MADAWQMTSCNSIAMLLMQNLQQVQVDMKDGARTEGLSDTLQVCKRVSLLF